MTITHSIPIITSLCIIGISIYLSKTTDLLKDISSLPDKLLSNKPYSFSRFQLLWWTVIIASCYTFLFAEKKEFSLLNDTCLILLGISLLTNVTGRIVDDNQIGKLKAGEIRHQDKDTEGFLIDLISDEYGISVHRFQAFIFNILLGVMFFYKFTTTMLLPEFSIQELSLLGISSSAYLAVKMNENNKPEREDNAQPTAPQTA